MAVKKPAGVARYVVLRDCAMPAAEAGGQGTLAVAGEKVDLDADTAALLIRDGMIAPDAGAPGRDS